MKDIEKERSIGTFSNFEINKENKIKESINPYEKNENGGISRLHHQLRLDRRKCVREFQRYGFQTLEISEIRLIL